MAACIDTGIVDENIDAAEASALRTEEAHCSESVTLERDSQHAVGHRGRDIFDAATSREVTTTLRPAPTTYSGEPGEAVEQPVTAQVDTDGLRSGSG